MLAVPGWLPRAVLYRHCAGVAPTCSALQMLTVQGWLPRAVLYRRSLHRGGSHLPSSFPLQGDINYSKVTGIFFPDLFSFEEWDKIKANDCFAKDPHLGPTSTWLLVRVHAL